MRQSNTSILGVINLNIEKTGNLLRQYRLKNGFTQKEVFILSGVTTEALRLLENGHSEPKISTLEILSNIYRVDLLHLIRYCREDYSFYSEDYICKINEALNKKDSKKFTATIHQMAHDLKATYTTGKTTRLNVKYLHFLDGLKKMRFNTFSDAENMICNLDSILLYFARNKSQILSGSCLYYIEFTIGICLAILYRQENCFGKSLEILERLNLVLEDKENKTTREHDYMITVKINTCYLYHRMDQHDKVIRLVDNVLRNSRNLLTSTHLSELLIRKAIAMYRLDIKGYKCILETVYSYETPERSRYYKDKIESTYFI